MVVKKMVLTGGPCAGKSTCLEVIKREFGARVVLVPEAATMLLSGGFPMPGRDLDFSPEWQLRFERSVAAVQVQLEEVYEMMAADRGQELLVLDRGLLDVAAYTPGGLSNLIRLYGIEVEAALVRYDRVVHLESVATAAPQIYGTAGNACRMESLEVAVELEHKTREAWKAHPAWSFISERDGVEAVVQGALAQVSMMLE